MGGGAGLRLRRATGTGNVDIPINRIVNDDTILDAAQASRSASDRGKLLGTSASDENQLSLFDVPIDQTARTAAANAQTAADGARAVADAATTVAEATNIANARAAAVAGPVLIVSNIASYDATQNRFEDSSGNEVVVPNGSIVTLTQAVYDAAVADSDFTPNAQAFFATRA